MGLLDWVFGKKPTAPQTVPERPRASSPPEPQQITAPPEPPAPAQPELSGWKQAEQQNREALARHFADLPPAPAADAQDAMIERLVNKLLADDSPDYLPQPTIAPLPQGPFRFIALDVETANDDPASICQIGLAFVRPDNSIITWSNYVDPEDLFSSANIAIHGITDDTIIEANAPIFEDALEHIASALTSVTVFQHSDFDRRCIVAACDEAAIEAPKINWADSVRVAQRAWPELKGNGGHGLANLRKHFGLSFRHHDAGEDARASAEIVLLAEKHTGLSAKELTAPAKRQFRKTFEPSAPMEGVATGPLYGGVVVFTGSLSISREDASQSAAACGLTVAMNVTKKTTLLVVGDQDLSLLAGHSKSIKHRKAEGYIANGQRIQILTETDFLAIVRAPAPS